MKSLKVHKTIIDGLLIIDLPVHEDKRGWFKENFQAQKMRELGLPEFFPVQNNISYNVQKGTTRGLHAEPWDKIISVANGKTFCAWADVRKNSKSYGKVVTTEVGIDKTVFVPNGVANSYQTLEPNTVYSYLVNKHWSPDAKYELYNLNSFNIKWPIPLEKAIISEKDENHPLWKPNN
jgi:dTDP-4-dehydrorhamnose 3,5-epimerase